LTGSRPARAIGEQLAGVQLLDVLGEHEHRQPGDLAPRLQWRPQALVGEGWRQPDIHGGHVGPLRGDRRDQVRWVCDCRGDLEAVRLEHPRQALRNHP
jgi:hypothetical protein